MSTLLKRTTLGIKPKYCDIRINVNCFLCFISLHLNDRTFQSDVCFCGNSLPATKVSDYYCYKPCPGETGSKCGGRDRLSVYETGIVLFC